MPIHAQMAFMLFPLRAWATRWVTRNTYLYPRYKLRPSVSVSSEFGRTDVQLRLWKERMVPLTE